MMWHDDVIRQRQQMPCGPWVEWLNGNNAWIKGKISRWGMVALLAYVEGQILGFYKLEVAKEDGVLHVVDRWATCGSMS